MTQTELALRVPTPAPRCWDWHVRAAQPRSVLALAAPLALVALVNMAMCVTDTILTAAFSAESLVAVAVGSDCYSIVFCFAAGVIGGRGPFYAQPPPPSRSVPRPRPAAPFGLVLMQEARLGIVGAWP